MKLKFKIERVESNEVHCSYGGQKFAMPRKFFAGPLSAGQFWYAKLSDSPNDAVNPQLAKEMLNEILDSSDASTA
jgi:hypothetical protein